MKKLLLILAMLLNLYGATGDISSFTVLPNGWTASIKFEGMATGGTFAPGLGTNNNPTTAKGKVIVRRLGFSSTAARMTRDDTIYILRQLRKKYPNNATDSNVTSGGDCIATLQLSTPVYVSDTVKLITIESGFYTKTGTPSNAFSSSTATNNSGKTYPSVIPAWVNPGWTVIGSTLNLYMTGFSWSGRNGSQLASVKFTASDKHGHSVSTTSSTMDTLSLSGRGAKVVGYYASISTASFTNGDTITANFSACPWAGDSLSTAASPYSAPTPLYSPQYYLCDRTGGLNLRCAVVDSANGNNSTGVIIKQSDFNQASPPAAYRHIFAAINALKDSLGNDISGSIVYLRSGNHVWSGGTITSGITTNRAFLTVRNFPGETPTVKTISGSVGLANWKLRFYGITWSQTGVSDAVVGVEYLWEDSCRMLSTTSLFGYNNRVYYLTNDTICFAASIPYSTVNEVLAIGRGNHFKLSSQIGINPYCFVGNISSGTGVVGLRSFYDGCTAPYLKGPVIAFNRFQADNNFGHLYLHAGDSIGPGAAIVQNIFESLSSVQPALQIAADNSTSDSINNIVMIYNTFAGQRSSNGYNDKNLNGGSPLVREDWTTKNNIFQQWNSVTDIHAHGGTPDGARTGNWSLTFGTGMSGNYIWDANGFGSSDYNSDGIYQIRTATYNINWVSDKSITGTGTGGGDYRLQSNSQCIGLPKEWLLPYDYAAHKRGPQSISGLMAPGAYADTSEIFGQKQCFILIAR